MDMAPRALCESSHFGKWGKKKNNNNGVWFVSCSVERRLRNGSKLLFIVIPALYNHNISLTHSSLALSLVMCMTFSMPLLAIFHSFVCFCLYIYPQLTNSFGVYVWRSLSVYFCVLHSSTEQFIFFLIFSPIFFIAAVLWCFRAQ